ncbi:MAG: hypothetical protein HGA38_02935 [Candidatus Moranbacteria bacterium]|nr:hypothetical protein [Candidatus Moranbacteria bacterium]
MNIWILFGRYAMGASIIGAVLVAAAMFGSPDEPNNAFFGGIFLMLTAVPAAVMSRIRR